jgi:hypothetical protein
MLLPSGQRSGRPAFETSSDLGRGARDCAVWFGPIGPLKLLYPGAVARKPWVMTRSQYDIVLKRSHLE